ncbi:PIN domain-containing protein [Allosphingosinicella humi]
MPYDAFTIDTNKAIQGGLNLEGGLLAQLTQFKEGQIDLILSEIVIREIHKHLLDQVRKARDSMSNAAAKVRSAQLVDEDAAAQLKSLVEAMPDPKKATGARLKRYVEATGAEVIPVALAPMDAVVASYFSSSPPFEPSGSKKAEFPDAIALLSIEEWAKQKAKKVLAVSEDGGWRAFGEKSEYVDVEPDFAKALEIVQEHAAAAEKAVAEWLGALEEGKLEGAAEEVEEELRRSLSEWQFYGEGHGAYHLELDSVELSLDTYAFDKFEDAYDITIVRIGSSQIVARVGVTFNATARAEFSLAAWDSIDKEYVGMGSQAAERELEFDGAFLLTLAGELAGGIDALEVEEIEVVEAVGAVDFGEVEMDYHDDEEDYRAWLAEEADADVAADVEVEEQSPF